MFGDDALGDLNIKMVEVARKVGAASKFTGSGGAVIAFCPDGLSQVKLLEDECQKAGFIVVPVKVVPSCLSANELQTLKKIGCWNQELLLPPDLSHKAEENFDNFLFVQNLYFFFFFF